jgi:hypothetical protein
MIINKFDDESNNVYNYRITFCEKYSSDNQDIKDKEVIKYSKIAANIKFRKCRYDPFIYNKVKKYI